MTIVIAQVHQITTFTVAIVSDVPVCLRPAGGGDDQHAHVVPAGPEEPRCRPQVPQHPH